ncbi:MAG: signal transduction histidine kinase, partial [Bryobacterales bacterium]|nr:signal transduction histidine kinase [Bryobacterales bacterium]
MPRTHKLVSKKRRVTKPDRPSPPPSLAVDREEFYADRERLIGELELQLTQLRMQEQELRHAQGEVEKSSQHYANLFNSAPIGYVVLDSVGTILEINEVGAALLHHKRQRLLTESFTRFVPKHALPDFLKHLRLCRSSQRQVTTELLLQTHEGPTIPVELVSACFTSCGRAPCYRTAILNISERRRAEQTLEQTEQNYGALVNSIDGIVWEGDARTGEFSFVSEQAERLLGYPVERWLREPDFWVSHIHPDD